MSRSTLLLNSSYEPLKVIDWKKAVSLWWTGKVEVVEEYDDFDLKSVSVTIKCPAVVRLLKYVKGNRHKVKFSRVNVFSRDKFTCQYCGCQPGIRELTYDHVVPRAQGGKTSWTNIATACYDCNAAKGNRTPEQAGMKLLNKPVKPSSRPHNRFTFNLPKTPEAWRDYLYWNSKLEAD